jgi:hypothetical protein
MPLLSYATYSGPVPMAMTFSAASMTKEIALWVMLGCIVALLFTALGLANKWLYLLCLIHLGLANYGMWRDFQGAIARQSMPLQVNLGLLAGTVLGFNLPFLAGWVLCCWYHRWKTGEAWNEQGMCINCGYNLTGNVSGVCPECGKRI